MSALIEKIRRARESQVEVGGLEFTVRRPTDLEMLAMTTGPVITQGDIMTKFVVGWGKVKELDLFSGGTGELVPFSQELFAEFIADRPDLWTPLSNAVVDKYKAHEKAKEETAKN